MEDRPREGKEIAAARRLGEIEERLAPGLAEWERNALTHQPQWEILRPTRLSASGGVKLTQQPDGSILAGGATPASSIYEITTSTKHKNITAFRLELIPDSTLPAGGSGRGEGGKGVVTLFEVKTGTRKVDLSRITADFKSEESELDLVIRPADQLKRGWGVNPRTNQPHYAVIEPARMIPGAVFTIRIGNEYEGAPVGRFRISVTSDEFPDVMPEAITKASHQATPRTKCASLLPHPSLRCRCAKTGSQTQPGRAIANKSHHDGDAGNGEGCATPSSSCADSTTSLGDRVIPLSSPPCPPALPLPDFSHSGWWSC